MDTEKRLKYELKITNKYRVYSKTSLLDILREEYNLKGLQSNNVQELVTKLVESKIKEFDRVSNEM